MSGGMPELGSKISLISKADIRYEGRLFTVDPQECTIALANVRSFGTEERETQFPVAPQNKVYDYILFRGSDIKDIRVVNAVTALPNDPAIVQMTLPPSMGQPSYQQSGFAHPIMSQMASMGGQYGTQYNLSMSAVGSMMGLASQNRPAISKQTNDFEVGHVETGNVCIASTRSTSDTISKDLCIEDGILDGVAGSSGTTTANCIITRKSPTMDQGTQVGQRPHHVSQLPQQQSKIGKVNDKSSVRHMENLGRERERANSGMSQHSEGRREKKDEVSYNRAVGQFHSHSQSTVSRGNRGGWLGPRGVIRNRNPRGRGNYRSNPTATIKTKNTLKFENDYDFEQANTEFEELRSQLSKTKIDGGTEAEKKDDSGNETGAGDVEPEDESEIVHYDKSKSFFDNISCEAVERSKGRSQRTDWRQERKLNSETFGVASVRRGGFRGRGYYSRGMYRNSVPSSSTQPVNFRGGFRGSRNSGRKTSGQVQNVAGNRMNNDSINASQSQQNKRLVIGAA